MSSQDESSRSDTPEIDYSVIRTAIQIGGKVVEQVLNGIHYGSNEVRNLLLEECDLILECKVCRNLFRSLPNFVAHKRVYCTPSYEEYKKKETELADTETEETVVIQPTSPKEGPDVDATASQKSIPEQSVIDKVINRSFEGQSKSYELYTKIAEKVEAKKAIKPASTVMLKSILSNPNAVLMKVSETEQIPNASENTNSDGSCNRATDTAGNVVSKITKTKPTISQLCEKLANQPIVPQRLKANSDVHTVAARPVRSRKSSPRKSVDNFIGMKDTNENRKSKTPSPSSVENGVDIPHNEPDSIDSNADFSADMQAFISDYTLDSSWLSHCDIKSQKCKTCNKSFTTPYGLKFHCKMKHVDKLVQYPCSTCTKSFTYFTALARHLRKVHTKSESYIEYIQAKLKGKHGRRKSLDDAETESNETESSPEGGRKSMLALDTGYKKCDKCGKICWKAKSYNRHYQYCKGLTDNTNKLQNGELSPSKAIGQKEKEQVKKANEKLKGPSNEVTENVKEKSKFNENLTIRTRKQLENGLFQSSGVTQHTQTGTSHKPTELVQNKQNIETAASTQPASKDIAKQTEEKEMQGLEVQMRQGSLPGPDKNVIAKKGIDMPVQNNPASSEKIKQTAETAVKTRKHGFESKSVEQIEKKDSLNTSNKTLQEKALIVKSSDRSSAANTEVTVKAKVIEKSTAQREKTSPVKTNAVQESKAVNKEYLKPVTRASDGTLALRESKNTTPEKLAQSVRPFSSDRSKSRDRNLLKENSKSEIEEKKQADDYIKPVTRRAESEILKVEEANTSGKIVPSDTANKNVDTTSGEAINKPNTTTDDTRNNNEIDQSKSQVRRPLRCTNVSLKISESPTDTQKPQSNRESLDSPTWSDNPMLKFKMTVKEMAELVESASLTKFARERKKKAKQILNKKQNGGSKTVSMTNSTKTLRSRVFKKKTGSTVKKVYGTRLSTSSKTEAVASSDSGESSHRYATRHTGVKSAGDIMNNSAFDKHSKEQLNNQEGTKESRSLSENSCDEVSNQPIESLEKTTLNSKRKEFLAAKRDQRRKFLLANKTASPRKESPEKSLQTRSRSTKEMTSVETPSPSKSKKMEKTIDNKKQQQTEKDIPVLRNYRFEKVVESKDEKIRMKTTEIKCAVSETASQHIPRRISDRLKSHKNESEITDADKISSVENENRIPPNAINERHSRRSASHEIFVQKKPTQSRAKSASFERPRRIVMQKNIQKENISKTIRARSSDNIQSSEVSSSGPVVENLQPLSHDPSLEMLKPSAMPKQSEDGSHSLVQTTSKQKGSQDSNNLKSPHDVYVTQSRFESFPKLDKVPEPAAPSVESDKKENTSHVHQTRLSTGSISHVDKSIKIIATELSSSAEDSSSELPSNKTSKDKKMRKRNLSAPQQTVKVEPKRYSLSTGVIQCSTCNKAFWKTKSYTAHIMKSPCGKKQREKKTEDKNDSPNSTINLKPAEEMQNANLSDTSSKVLTSNKTDQVTYNSTKRIDAADHRPNMKRTFPTSPKIITEPCQSSEDSFGHTKAKRPRLEQETSARKESLGKNESKLATRKEIENRKSENKSAVEEFRKDLIIECSDSTKDLGQITIENEKLETRICKGNDLSELPGTSKDFFDEDSDTGSEFSGFSEADISFPKYPENISDLDSNDLFKSDSGEDYNESLYHGDESCIASDDFLEKEHPDTDKRKLISVEEIWVDKKPGMPVTEKSKSNRIYVMDTDRSNKLHCQDKINIDSFVDEDNLKCLRCDREFSSVSNVRLHVIRHLGWKRYQCRLCSVYSSYNLSEVRLHLWRKHDIREKHDLDLQKHIIDLNKEAGKKRCSKRMKTIQKKKEIENTNMQGDKVLESKRQPKKVTVQKKATHTIDSVGISDTDSLNLSEATNHMQSSKNRNQLLGAIKTASAARSVGKDSSQNESGDIGSQKSPRNVFEDTCRYLQRPTTENNTGIIGLEKADCSTKDISEGMKFKITSDGSSPIKKSVRLAAKEDSRKTATEILKGPKTSPKKLNVSPSSGEKKSSPRKLQKSPPPVIEHDKADESPLVKARQMLAMVLK